MLESCPKVYIVLATFNGSRFLQQQIDSIKNQTFSQWHLLIRDDRSTDSTANILRAAAKEDPRIEVLSCGEAAPVGAMRNFSILLESALAAGSELCFLADQDDVWLPDKMEIQLQHFPELGREENPLLVHSEMRIVDEIGQALAPSFFRLRNLTPKPDKPLNQLLSMNYVTGCSVCLNRRLLELAMPIPKKAIMHDWWLALVAATCGDIHYVSNPLLDYRQHEDNVIGAEGEEAAIRRVSHWGENWRRGETEFSATFDQVADLRCRLTEHRALSGEANDILIQYIGLSDRGLLGRAGTARRLELRQGKSLLRFIFYLHLLLFNR